MRRIMSLMIIITKLVCCAFSVYNFKVYTRIEYIYTLFLICI